MLPCDVGTLMREYSRSASLPCLPCYVLLVRALMRNWGVGRAGSRLRVWPPTPETNYR